MENINPKVINGMLEHPSGQRGEYEKTWSTCGGGGGLVAKSCPTLATPGSVACQAPLSTGFSRQEYWSGLPFPSPGDLPSPGIEPRSPVLSTGHTKHSFLIFCFW